MRTAIFIITTILITLSAQSVGNAESRSAFFSGKSSFSIRFGQEITPYTVTGVFVLPGQKLVLEALDRSPRVSYSLTDIAGKPGRISDSAWEWTAPAQSGLYPVQIKNQFTGESSLLNIFVMVPRSRKNGEYLNGYRIGKYPVNPLNGLESYRAPAGFIEVTPENENTNISPNFTLKQFLCKQAGSYPKYVVLRERLLLKLEVILEESNKNGHRADSFTVMSGYRTPFYNKSIGNSQYSRHIYGDAADIFIDWNPRSGMMDDLNGDGKIDYKDAIIFYDMIDNLYDKPWYRNYIGGLGAYKERFPVRGPFVHVDARGTRARWGR